MCRSIGILTKAKKVPINTRCKAWRRCRGARCWWSGGSCCRCCAANGRLSWNLFLWKAGIVNVPSSCRATHVFSFPNLHKVFIELQIWEVWHLDTGLLGDAVFLNFDFEPLWLREGTCRQAQQASTASNHSKQAKQASTGSTASKHSKQAITASKHSKHSKHLVLEWQM